jgi:hypothetical protein
VIAPVARDWPSRHMRLRRDVPDSLPLVASRLELWVTMANCRSFASLRMTDFDAGLAVRADAPSARAVGFASIGRSQLDLWVTIAV